MQMQKVRDVSYVTIIRWVSCSENYNNTRPLYYRNYSNATAAWTGYYSISIYVHRVPKKHVTTFSTITLTIRERLQ